MPNKLTDEEIVKALECCAVLLPKFKCDECPAWVNSRCTLKTEYIINLINRLQAENGVYETCNARKDEAIRHLEAENERLKPFEDKIAEFNSQIRVENMLIFANSFEEWLEFCDNLKSEAYKKVEEKIHATTWYHINKNGELVMGANGETDIPLFKAEDIFNLLKELVGDKNEV